MIVIDILGGMMDVEDQVGMERDKGMREVLWEETTKIKDHRRVL